MILASAHERGKEFEQSARTLMGIPLETGQRLDCSFWVEKIKWFDLRGYRPEFKMELYLRITELFLEAGNIEEADRHVKRASLLQQDVKEDALVLKYKVGVGGNLRMLLVLFRHCTRAYWTDRGALLRRHSATTNCLWSRVWSFRKSDKFFRMHSLALFSLRQVSFSSFLFIKYC